MVQKWSKTALECLITVKQPILPYISDIDSLLNWRIKYVEEFAFWTMANFASFVIPGITAKKRQSDARFACYSLRTGKFA